MAYIGNAKTPLILSTNVRDDLIPDGVINTFVLSQEVPGGDENNIIVLRQKFVNDVLVDDTNLIQLIDNTIVIGDSYLAAAFSVVQPDDLLVVEYNDIVQIRRVVSSGVLYNRDQITITVDTDFTDNVAVGAHAFKITRSYYSFWELLDTTEYSIKGDIGTDVYHRQIELTQTPNTSDKIFVLHRGDATYNFVPSPGSVGVDQLSSNLRTFVCDRFIGDGEEDTYTISQTVVDPKSLLVTIDGKISESDDPTQEFEGEWELIDLPETKTQQIKFHTAPELGNKIRILHLGFVSGQRRALFAPGQGVLAVPQNSVGTQELKNSGITSAKISDGAVTSSKIAPNAIDGTKILLDGTTNDSIKISFGNQGVHALIGSSAAGTSIHANQTLSVFDHSSGVAQKFLTFSSSGIEPKTASQTIGTAENKFTSINLSGTAFVGGLDVDGTANVSGHVDIEGNLSTLGATHLHDDVQIDGALAAGASTISGNITLSHLPEAPKFTVDGVVVSDLKVAFELLVNKVNNLVPIGSIMIWSGETMPDANWKICDGSSLSISQHPILYQRIQFVFGGSIESGEFNLPDLRNRVPVGKHTNTLGNSEALSVASRSLTHSHVGGVHTHTVPAHAHSIPTHSHSIIAGKSTLSITSSGTHTTDFTHGHGGETSFVDLSHIHNADHGHSNGTATSVNVPHTHPISLTSGSKTPTIAIRATSSDTLATTDSSISAGVYDDFIALSAAGAGATTSPKMLRYAYSPAHTHAVNGNTDSSLTTHSHPVTIPTSSNFNTGPANTSLNHRHTFTIPSTTFSSGSTGTHSHDKEYVQGVIGDPASPNASVSAFNSNPSDVLTTQSAGSESTTGPATTPHLVVNFIIKVKND